MDGTQPVLFGLGEEKPLVQVVTVGIVEVEKIVELFRVLAREKLGRIGALQKPRVVEMYPAEKHACYNRALRLRVWEGLTNLSKPTKARVGSRV